MKKSMSKSTVKSTIKRNNIEEAILGVVKASEKPLSTTDIASVLGRSWHTVIRYCLGLEIKGKLSKIDIGRISIWQVKNE